MQLGDLERLSLISLAAFKRTAEQRRFFIEKTDLPPPDPEDVRPPLVGELK